jgi:DNA-binding PadR family transcriptional regulator
MSADTPVLSRLEAIILSALASKERYGLEIIDAVKKATGQTLSVGGLYTTLHRMERKGLVTARWGESTEARQGARRRYYRFTGLGNRAFAETKSVLMKAFRFAPTKADIVVEVM